MFQCFRYSVYIDNVWCCRPSVVQILKCQIHFVPQLQRKPITGAWFCLGLAWAAASSRLVECWISIFTVARDFWSIFVEQWMEPTKAERWEKKNVKLVLPENVIVALMSWGFKCWVYQNIEMQLRALNFMFKYKQFIEWIHSNGILDSQVTRYVLNINRD